VNRTALADVDALKRDPYLMLSKLPLLLQLLERHGITVRDEYKALLLSVQRQRMLQHTGVDSR